MLNIPFLRKVARLLHILAWCYIIILFPAMAFWINFQLAVARLSSVLRPGSPRVFPWADFASGLVEGLAVGLCFMVLAQLACLAIRVIEHLRSVDQERAGPPQPRDREGLHDAGGAASAPLVGSQLSRGISRLALVLGWVMIGSAVGAVALQLAYPHLVPGTEVPYTYWFSRGGALALMVWFAWATVMLLLSQGILWVEEAVAHLRGLAQWEEDAEGPSGGEEP